MFCSILQVRKVRLIQIKRLAQGHASVGSGAKMWETSTLAPAQAVHYIPFEPFEIAGIGPFF